MMTYAVRVAAASRAPAASAGESGWPLRVMWPDSASARSLPAQSSARAAHSMKKLGSSGWSYCSATFSVSVVASGTVSVCAT